MKKYNNIIFALTSSFLLILGCREELELETNDFESALVVEATITNELKHQEVKVSRTFLLEDTEQITENNADVKIIDNNGLTYTFSQNEEGVYISDSAFEALPNIEYTLEINTTDGKEYNSNKQSLTPISQIDNLYPELVDDETNGPGVQIFADNNNEGSTAEYFRYEWEETYKLVAPNTYGIGVLFLNFQETGDICGKHAFYDVEFFNKTQQEKICYSSRKNTNIIQTSTSNLTENIISRQPIRFIPQENETDSLDVSMLRNRYSIKVKQLSQSIEAFTYYKIIAQLGGNESILSENQPGFVQGNLMSISNNSDRVIGFFEVASVSELRIFFNYTDVNIPLPNYLYECDIRQLDFNDNVDTSGDCDIDENERNTLFILVDRENYQLINYNQQTNIYTIARQECVNCTSAGTNIQPDFWID